MFDKISQYAGVKELSLSKLPRVPRRQIIVTCVLTFLLTGIFGTAFARQRLIPAITKEQAGRGRYHNSPDGKYTVKLVDLDAQGALLTLYRVLPSRMHAARREMLLHPIENAETFIWAPKQPHTLIFAASGDNGRAMLALWNGGRLHMLYHVSDPDAEWFEVDGVYSNGRTLVFRHARLDGPDKDYQRQLTLSLPEPSQPHRVSRSRRRLVKD